MKSDTYHRILNYLGFPLVGLYVISMFIVPWIHGSLDWNYIQKVWYDWQSLNVAMLAFFSSIVALNISRYNAEKQRERNFTAAKAFLPESLSELVSYFKESARFLEAVWGRRKSNETFNQHQPLLIPVPSLPSQHKEVFARAIKHAETDIARYLANILVLLQIHHSRMNLLHDAFGPNGTLIIGSSTVISYLNQLAELKALVSRLFPFARSMASFDDAELTLDDFSNSYANLDIELEKYDGLIEFTKTRLEK